MAFVFDSYMGPAKTFGGRCTLCDLLEDTNGSTVEETSGISFKKYPPTLLIVGDRDPLGLLHSARRARVMLETKVPWYFCIHTNIVSYAYAEITIFFPC
jgi:hypothetical protein